MRKILLKSLLAAVCLLVAFGASAQSVKFKDDKSGLYFETVLNEATGKYDQVWGAPMDEWSELKGDIVIPDEVTYNGTTYPVTGIAKNFLFLQHITSLVISENVVEIGDSAFGINMYLTKVQLPKGLKKMGKSVFSSCEALKSIDLPSGLERIEDSVFAGCSSLESVNLPEGLEYIGESAFYGCSSLESIDLPESLTTIGWQAFRGSGLKSVAIPVGLAEGDGAFMLCKTLSSVSFQDGIERIPRCFFDECESLENVIIPETVTEIGDYAFAYTSLKNITIPENVKYLRGVVFYGCKELESVTLCMKTDPSDAPFNGYSFGSNFAGCDKLKSIIVSEDNPTFKVVDGTLLSKDGTRFLFYPAGLDNEEYSIPEDVVSVENGAFMNRYNGAAIPFKKLHFPRSVSSVGIYALAGLMNKDSENDLLLPSLITELSVANPEPPAITGMDEYSGGKLLADDAYANATLYVPVGSSDAYKKAEGWKYFEKIEEKDFSGVASIETSGVAVAAQGGNIVVSGADNAEVAVYGIDGRLVYKGTGSVIPVYSNGIYIVTVAGTTVKVIL